MLRILFFLLAIVAAILAIVLQMPELYAAAGVLVLIAIIVILMTMRGRHRKEKETLGRGASVGDEELQDLGIVNIRPREKRVVASAPESEDPEMQTSEDAPVEANSAFAGRQTRSDPASGLAVRRKERSGASEDRSANERLRKEVLTPYLQALHAAIDANTVCLLKQEESEKYRIEAIISKNAYARSQGFFSLDTPLLSPGASRKPVTLLRVGEKGISSKSLRYYLEPIAVRQAAIAPILYPDEAGPYVLVADTMEDGGLGTVRQRILIEQFSGLLATILDRREAAAPEIVSEEEVVEAEVRPRRDIIAEEMQKAREQKAELSLALVYLNGGEQLEDRSEIEVMQAEKELEKYLQAMTETGRVERFGELTFGVFYPGGGAGVEEWAVGLQRGITSEDGLPAGGVSIGIAVLNQRHDSPEALREDATEALRESFATGACTIIE